MSPITGSTRALPINNPAVPLGTSTWDTFSMESIATSLSSSPKNHVYICASPFFQPSPLLLPLRNTATVPPYKALVRLDSRCLAAFMLDQAARKALPTPERNQNLRTSWVGKGYSYLFISLPVSYNRGGREFNCLIGYSATNVSYPESE